MDVTHKLFLQVLSQATGEFPNRRSLNHSFISAYEQACLWVEANGYGECTDTGAILKVDPWEYEIDSVNISDSTDKNEAPK